LGIAEFAGLDIARLDNDGLENDVLEIGGLVPAVLAAAVPQPRCCEICLLAPIKGFARFCENCAHRVADKGAKCPLCRAVM